MQGIYVAEIDIASMTTAKGLIYIAAPSDAAVEILSAHAGNADNDTNEQAEFSFTKVATIGSPAGTSITPIGSENGSPAAGSTVLGNLTTEPTSYEGVDWDYQGVPLLGGYDFDPTPEERPVISPSGAAALRLRSTIASSKLICQVKFREIGG